MATSEYQPQPIVRNFGEVEFRRIDDRFGGEFGKSLELFLQTSLTPEPVDGFVFCCLNDPGARRVRHSLGAPLIDGGGERFLRGILGEFEIAKLTDQCGDNPSPIGTVNRVDSNVRVWKHV
jgi:hypothetical protein